MTLPVKRIFVFATIVFFAACTQGKYAATNKVYNKQIKAYAKLLLEYPVHDSSGLPYAPEWVGTTNFSLRHPSYVIIHHTAQNSCEQTLRTFTLSRTQVSSHYVICRDGTVYHMLNDLLRGHHAGAGKWGKLTDMNSCSIGIEIDNNGNEPFSDKQMNSLLLLLGRLKRTFNIPQPNFIGHLDWAPGRKVDPSRFFSWKTLADNDFGFWYDTTGVQVPENFNALQGLQLIGYNISKPASAILSYKIHFVPQDTTRVLNEADQKIISSLVKKYQ